MALQFHRSWLLKHWLAIGVLDADLKAGTFDQEELLPARALEPLERVEEWCVLDSLLRALSVLPVFCSKSMYAPKD